MSIFEEVKNQTIKIDDFLAAQTESAIQDRMFDKISPDLDKSEGSYIWDALIPTSFEHALVYIGLRYALDMAFPQRSFGEQLSLHSEAHGSPRRLAQAATGYVTVTGSPGFVVPVGTKFSTTVSAGSLEAPKYYSTTVAVTIPAGETVNIPISADIAGSSGNVREGEISLNIQKLAGIFSVTNPEVLDNGIDEEKDDILLPRMLERVQNPPSSGNKADYKRWAKEVPGVGDAIVQALWKGPGTVKVVIIGIDGNPVNEDIIFAAQEYIDPGIGGTGEGKAPIGAHVTVGTVTGVPIFIVIPSIEYDSGYTQPDVLPILEKNITAYLSAVPPGGLLRLKEIESVITESDGVADFDTITINGNSANLQLAEEEKAVIGGVMIL